MAKITSTEKLIELVKRSGLVSKEELASLMGQYASSGGVVPSAPEQVVKELIERQLLTRWQADQLLNGKYRGFRLGKYTLKGHLGTGGMSSVYLSEHPIMRRPVAIKVLPKSRVSKSSYLERFELEARAVAALDHPNIVRAYDIDNEGDTHYIVMEYVEGQDFQRMVEQNGPLAYEQAADFICQAAVGLQHAHDAGVVHRDIKPANCLVDLQGVVKVLDMGLAKFAQDEQSLSAVHKDNVVGTADYLAPEQAVNSSKVDSRADIYGLGGTLYFLLTGSPPFPEGTLTERLLKHQKEEPKSIYDYRPNAPPTLVDICRRMMTKKRGERTQTAAKVAEELRIWLDGRGYGKSAYKDGGRGAKGKAGSDSAAPPVESRWHQIVTSSSTGNASKPKSSNTKSSSRGDTSRDADDDLTLAPLDEEERDKGSNVRPGAGSSATQSDPQFNKEVLHRIESEIGISQSASGSLVDLLEENDISSVSTSGIRLPQKKQTLPTWIWGLVVGSVLLIALLIALLTFL